MDKNNITSVKIPAGAFCGHNCSDGCIYWNPYDRDSNGRQYSCVRKRHPQEFSQRLYCISMRFRTFPI